MPYDGNGNFIRAHNWTADAANSLDINATEMDQEDNGIAAGLTNAVTRDGQGKMSVDFLPNSDNTLNLGNGSFRWATVNGLPISSIVSGIFYKQTGAEALASITPTVFTSAPGVVLRYGADPTGVADSATAFASAIAQASQSGGAEVFIPGGVYLIGTGLVVSTSGVKIRSSGMGSVQLKANANSITMLKIAASNCTVESILLDGNGKTSVDGLVIAPANEATTTVTSQQNFNTFRDVQIQNCNNGLRMRAGPTVTGTDSGSFYNMFFGCFFLNCVRSIWLQNSVNNGNGAPNRCSFHGCRGGSAGTVCNTGLQIDAGGTNQFFGVHFEGIANGTSPNTIPTAVQIALQGASGVNNGDNFFFGCVMEANTLDLTNLNQFTQIYGGFWNATKFGVGNLNPTVFLTGDPSSMPFILPGLVNAQGLAGYPSGYWGMSQEIADTGKQWQAYTLSTSVVSNTATVVNATSNYRQLSNMVEWVGIFQFNASVAGTQINITPPVAPNAAQYTALIGNAPFYTFSVNNGAGVTQVAGGWTSTGKLYFTAPTGNWNTSGNNNTLTFQISYHA